MPPLAATTSLLLISNVFMTFAWYAHLKDFKDKSWWIAALISWGIALMEYLFQVPANRIGYQSGIGLAQLKILQEVITLAVFVPFALFYMGERPRLDFVWAGLCLIGAVYFIFRGGMGGKFAARLPPQGPMMTLIRANLAPLPFRGMATVIKSAAPPFSST